MFFSFYLKYEESFQIACSSPSSPHVLYKEATLHTHHPQNQTKLWHLKNLLIFYLLTTGALRNKSKQIPHECARTFAHAAKLHARAPAAGIRMLGAPALISVLVSLSLSPSFFLLTAPLSAPAAFCPTLTKFNFGENSPRDSRKSCASQKRTVCSSGTECRPRLAVIVCTCEFQSQRVSIIGWHRWYIHVRKRRIR